MASNRPIRLFNLHLHKYNPVTKTNTKVETVVWNVPYAIAKSKAIARGYGFFYTYEETFESKQRQTIFNSRIKKLFNV